MANKENSDFIVTIVGPDHMSKDYAEECQIPYEGKLFAVLDRIPDEGDLDTELETVLTRMEFQDDGTVSYVPPTEGEFEAVSAIYDSMD